MQSLTLVYLKNVFLDPPPYEASISTFQSDSSDEDD